MINIGKNQSAALNADSDKGEGNMQSGYLHAKLRSMYVIGLLLPLMMAFMVFLGIQSARTVRDEQRLNDNVVSSLAYNIETCMKSMNRCSLTWTSQDAMIRFFKTMTRSHGALSASAAIIVTNYRAACLTTMVYSGVTPLGVGYYPLDNPGGNYYLNTNSGTAIYQEPDYPDQAWYQSAVAALGSAVYTPIVQDSLYPKEENGVFSVARLVTELDTRAPLGILKVDISASYFDELFSQVHSGETSGYQLLDQAGSVIYSTSGALSQLTSEGDKPRGYTVYTAPVGETGWQLACFVSPDDQSHLLRPLLLMTMLVGLAAVSISFAVFRLSSRQLIDPLHRILTTIDNARNGDFFEKIDLGKCKISEFTLIADQYNRMVDSLSEHIEHEYNAKINQQRAEFMTLQMQINPHFLYNTMNSFVALNRIGAKHQLEEALITLTAMFRYTCGNVHETSVREEFDFIRKYLALQQLRFQERIIWSVELDEDCADYTLPKLLVQPLVENAVVHGLEPVDRPVHIAVIATHAQAGGQTCLALIVADDGSGADNAQVSRNHMGIGLDNIRKRIACLSPASTLSTLKIPGEGTVCCILLPVCAIMPSKEAAHENDHC